VLKRAIPLDQIEEEHTERPDVRFFRVSVLENKFWTHATGSTNDRSGHLIAIGIGIELLGQSKIAQTNLVLLGNQYVAQLEIAVEDVVPVEVLDGEEDLNKEEADGLFGEVPGRVELHARGHFFTEVCSVDVLHDEVVGTVVREGIDVTDNVWVRTHRHDVAFVLCGSNHCAALFTSSFRFDFDDEGVFSGDLVGVDSRDFIFGAGEEGAAATCRGCLRIENEKVLRKRKKPR